MNGTASRNKGAQYERDVVAHLRANGYPHVERRIAGMAADRGDITGWPSVVIECKNRKAIDLAGFIDQLEDEIVEAGADTGFCIVKRTGVADVGQHYAVTTVHRMLALMAEAGR